MSLLSDRWQYEIRDEPVPSFCIYIPGGNKYLFFFFTEWQREMSHPDLVLGVRRPPFPRDWGGHGIPVAPEWRFTSRSSLIIAPF